jgi:hypothetical protein
MTPHDWAQVWPFFRAVVAAGETYAYPLDLTSDQARAVDDASAGADRRARGGRRRAGQRDDGPPGTFDSASHGSVGLHVMHLAL